MSPALLSVRDLRISFPTQVGPARAVDGVGFDLNAGETLGIVGESGSGKTLSALAVMGLVPRPGTLDAGSVTFRGRDLLSVPKRQLRQVRGADIGMIFQEPMTSLHPTLKVGFQIGEAIRAHQGGLSTAQVDARVVELLDQVGIPEPHRRAEEYAHTWSGGMRQRAMIAMAVANNPDVLIADEPTTALDVTIQAQVLELLREMKKQTGAALILISHDLGVITEMSDRIAVMYAGRIVEAGSLSQIFANPLHPYTAGLMASIPTLEGPIGSLPSIPGRPPDIASLPSGCSFHPRCAFSEPLCSNETPVLGDASDHRAACFFSDKVARSTNVPLDVRPVSDSLRPAKALLSVENLHVRYGGRRRLFERRPDVIRAVDGVTFSVRSGETLGLVGESGCGKTTTARAILGLVEPSAGVIRFRGNDLAGLTGTEMRRVRKEMQAVFQDPYGSLNPRKTVEKIVASPLEVHGGFTRQEIRERVRDLLRLVSLGHELLDRYPAALSGGQRQRVGIARALALEPAMLILDEPLSALDVSIQAQILNLLRDLQDRLGISYLLIAHDLAAVRHLADRVAVMYLGRIVELGDRDDVYSRPAHPYTKALLSAVPIPDPAASREDQIVLQGDLPDIGDRTVGCRFASRCFRAEPQCLEIEPGLKGEGRSCACLFPLVGISGER